MDDVDVPPVESTAPPTSPETTAPDPADKNADEIDHEDVTEIE
ncbi:hypothetical protein [Aeoliella straminimaris]|nr:hypothetical protein [Aeoliella straminimaris]